MEEKKNVKVEEVKAEETKVEETVKEEKKEPVKLFVERESFTGSDGKEYWSYILKGVIRGRAIKVDFAPKDKGGYEPLDILFDVQPKAELIIGEDEMTSESGKKTKFNTYTLKTVDEDGMDYTCSVKPARDSDKSLLNMIIKQANR